MRHEDAQPEQDKIVIGIAESTPDLGAISTWSELPRIHSWPDNSCLAIVDRLEVTVCPVGNQHGQINFIILLTIIEVIQPVCTSRNRIPRLASFQIKIGNIIAHPEHRSPQPTLEPHAAPLSRPMVRIPNVVLFIDERSQMPHVQISANQPRVSQ